MVKMNYVGAAVVLSALTLVSSQSLALPTIDPADIAGTISIVKSGIENIKGVKNITGTLGKLNSIVGDAAGTLSRFKEKYGDDIQKAMDAADKVKDRVGKSAEAYKELESERSERKQQYQAIMDKVGLEQVDVLSAVADKTPQKAVVQDLQITSQNRHYDDTAAVDENAAEAMSAPAAQAPEPVEEAEEDPVNNLSLRRGFGRQQQLRAPEAEPSAAQPAVLSTTKAIPDKQLPAKNIDAAVAPAIAPMAAPIAAPKAAPIAAPEAAPAAAPAVTPAIKKFRVAPMREKLSSRRSADYPLAFALNLGLGNLDKNKDNSSGTASGNPSVGEKMVFPYALLCGGDAESYVNDENKQKECIDKLIRNNNTKNHIDALANRRECRNMLYKTMVAMLAEATNSKAKAATYTDILEEQKKDSSQSTQIRDDLAVLGMSTYQTQLLLNEMSLNLASQILLYTAQQVCQASDDVLQDESAATDGEK